MDTPKIMRISFASDNTMERNDEREDGGAHGCYVCHAPMKQNAKHGTIHVVGGGVEMSSVDAAMGKDYDRAGAMGLFSVGSECLKKIPAAFRMQAGYTVPYDD